MSKLTRRQQEVARLLGQGYNQKQIAEKLVISYSTVCWHTKTMRQRVGLNTAQIAIRAAGSPQE